MALTLEELKAENKAKEELEQNKQVDNSKDVIKDEYVELNETNAEDSKESTGEDSSVQDVELDSWQLTEETVTSEDDKKSGFVPNHEAAKRRKQTKALRGELKEKDSELDELKKQIEALQGNNAHSPEPVKQLTRPTREQFDYDDDAYDAAIDKYYDDKFSQKLTGQLEVNQKKAEQEKQQQSVALAQQKSLDSHYERASKLVDDGKITADSYKNADAVVRRSIEAIMPNQGDSIVNALISTLSNLGDGSEKVMYQLGVNSSKLQELNNKLVSDPTGLTASMYLGQLQSQIQNPSKRTSNAPKPAISVEGEGGGNGRGGTLHKEYAKSDDLQTRINLKRKAKSAGIDVSKW